MNQGRTITYRVRLFGGDKLSDAFIATARRKPMTRANGRPMSDGTGGHEIRMELILALYAYPGGFVIRLRYSR